MRRTERESKLYERGKREEWERERGQVVCEREYGSGGEEREGGKGERGHIL